ncbi:hypothetical protein SLS62_010177 [Diatrype stigma]|uniref:polynucleotide adenylyltransferase n=1 Tax=Diatrype stigma TaxID=117547 RepID=A0AAN9UD01_9PEZI
MAHRSQDHYVPLPPPPASSTLPPRPPSPQQSRTYSDRLPPPPPPQQQQQQQRWDDDTRRRVPDDRFNPRDSPRDDRRGDNGYRGPFSDLRQSSARDSYPRARDHDRNRGRDGERRDEFRPPQGAFTFRAEGPPGLNVDSYRPSAQDGRGPGPDRFPRRQENGRSNRDRDRPPRNHDRNQNRGRGNQRSRPFPQRFVQKAADRLLLHSTHDQEAELMLGDTTGRVTYRDPAELSDSDEAAMDISDESGGEDNSARDNGEPAAKRARTMSSAPDRPQEAPKWSNPDPYTALPPPDETTRKKLDMVQLIRKARVEAEAKKPAVATEADFISCDLSEDEGNGKNPVVSSREPRSQRFAGRDTQRQQSPQRPGIKENPIDLTASASLGNRKRTFDDQIKLPHASLKPVRRMASTGTIVPDWQPVQNEDPCPWAQTDHSATPSMATRLHKEIIDFYEYVRPRDFEERVRQDLVENLRTIIKKKWPDADLYPFGSFMSGLYLPTADMDIAICSYRFVETGRPVYSAKSNLFALRAWLTSHRVAYRNEIELITRAKVPLVKYADGATALKVDISIEKLDGHNAIQTFLDWKTKYPAMPILVSVIKHFLLMRGLNEPVNGGIGGFSVICLVVHLLNSLPQVQSGSMVPEHHLGELLMEFFDYYGNKFNYQMVAIRMNPPGLVNKNDVSNVVYRNRDRLSILDPNNPENDISGGSANTATILKHFSQAYAVLKERMSTLAGRNGLLLEPIFEGKYSNFQVQRDYLQRLASQGSLKSQKSKHY